MYSLDVNFLNDPTRRGSSPKEGASAPSAKPSQKEMVPLFAGVLLGLLLPGAALGAWLFLQNQVAALTEQGTQLDSQIAQAEAANQKITKLNQEAEQIKAETTALASVVNYLPPWSALLQDIRDRVPPKVQITGIAQKAPPVTATAAPVSPSPGASPGAAAAPPVPTPLVEITGRATSFNDVNDFLLTLKQSRLLDAAETRILTAELRENSTQVEQPKAAGSNVQLEIKLPKEVAYKIETRLSDAAVTELMREWERKGAVGIVTRLRTLQRQGVLSK